MPEITTNNAQDVETLGAHAKNIRRHVVRMARGKGEGYVGQGLQASDLFAALFCSEMDWTPDPDREPNRDRFVLSTGHYSIVLWGALAEIGVIPEDSLDRYGADGDVIAMSTERGFQEKWVELTGGSLGHGLGVSAGIAYGKRLQGLEGRVFNYMTDGEIQEGSVWEAAMFASDVDLGSLVNVVDVNRTQADGPLVIEIEPLVDKYRAFGWWAEEINGNDMGEIVDVLRAAREADGPKAIVCHTQMGYGVPLIMQRERNHFVRVDDDEWDKVARQVEEWE